VMLSSCIEAMRVAYKATFQLNQLFSK